MAFDDLTIPGDYSDYVISEEEIKLNPKMTKFGAKVKNRYGKGEYRLLHTEKKEDSEHLKIKCKDSRKEDRILLRIFR